MTRARLLRLAQLLLSCKLKLSLGDSKILYTTKLCLLQVIIITRWLINLPSKHWAGPFSDCHELTWARQTAALVFLAEYLSARQYYELCIQFWAVLLLGTQLSCLFCILLYGASYMSSLSGHCLFTHIVYTPPSGLLRQQLVSSHQRREISGASILKWTVSPQNEKQPIK